MLLKILYSLGSITHNIGFRSRYEKKNIFRKNNALIGK